MTEFEQLFDEIETVSVMCLSDVTYQELLADVKHQIDQITKQTSLPFDEYIAQRRDFANCVIWLIQAFIKRYPDTTVYVLLNSMTELLHKSLEDRYKNKLSYE